MPTGVYERTEEHRRKLSISAMGRKHSEETKKKLSLIMKGNSNFKGKHHTEEEKRRRSEFMKGMKRSEETKKKMSEAFKKQYKNGERKVWNKGLTKENLEWRKRISELNKGRIVSEETKIKIIETRKRLFSEGKLKPNSGCYKKGNAHYNSKTTNQKISEAHKRNWMDEDYRNRILKNFKNRPTNPERKLLKIIEKYGLEFQYVGNGKVWLKKNMEVFNPDFINKEKKLIIEVFGYYWHNREDMKKRDIRRFECYIKSGFNVLIIYDYELIKNYRFGEPLGEKKILERLLSFYQRI